jgi:hypothetical protein
MRQVFDIYFLGGAEDRPKMVSKELSPLTEDKKRPVGKEDVSLPMGRLSGSG